MRPPLYDFAEPMPSADLLVEFVVPGVPQQRGSKRAALIPKKGGGWLEKNGRPIVAARDDNEKSKGWMELAKVVGANAWQGRPLYAGPVALSVEFRFARIDGHYGSKRGVRYLKPTAPYYVAKTPDLDKLMRAICDSLTGIVIVDDKQIVAHREIEKVYTEGAPGAAVKVFSLTT